MVAAASARACPAPQPRLAPAVITPGIAGNPCREAALDDIGGRIRRAILEKRNEEVMYHVGRPGEDHFVLRTLQAWGVDGHNRNPNVSDAPMGHRQAQMDLVCGRRRVTGRLAS